MQSTAAIGSLRMAKEYLSAATRIQAPPRSEIEAFRLRLSWPAYFLVGHAIELSLKGYLLAQGMSTSQLRSRAYGHDLSALLAECRRRRMGLRVKLSPNELAGIRALDVVYSAKEFEYVVEGGRHLPPYGLVHTVATRLCEGLYDYYRNQLKAAHEKNCS